MTDAVAALRPGSPRSTTRGRVRIDEIVSRQKG